MKQKEKKERGCVCRKSKKEGGDQFSFIVCWREEWTRGDLGHERRLFERGDLARA